MPPRDLAAVALSVQAAKVQRGSSVARAQHPLAWTGSLDACVTPWGPAGCREQGWRAADACPPSQHSLPGSRGTAPGPLFTAQPGAGVMREVRGDAGGLGDALHPVLHDIFKGREVLRPDSSQPQ